MREFIELPNSHKVRYLIVGGNAVAYHGYPRATGDIDFFVELSQENAAKLEQALIAFGFGGLGLTAKDFQQPGIVIQLGRPPNRIDLLTGISGVEFAEAWERRVSASYDGLLMHFADEATLLAK